MTASLLLSAISRAEAATAAPALSAEQIVKRALARAALSEKNAVRDAYAFQKSIVTEDLDTKGKVKERKEKDVLTQGDTSYIQRIRINGKDLAGAELQRQRDAEIKARQKITQQKNKQREDSYEHYLNSDVVSRFELKLVGTEAINGRPAYVVSFRPRNGKLPINQLADRLINHLSGKAWIDTADYEIAKTDIHLDEEVSFWAGLIGTLKRVDFSYEKTRVAEGVWLQSLLQGEFEGRKLLDKMHVRTRAESKDFRKVSNPVLGIGGPLR
ncbi:MAG TPA: hypothetical protein VI454_13975 [Verrucomicrobiae bacterium]